MISVNCLAQLTPNEKEGLEKALFLGNVASSELRIAKDLPSNGSSPSLVGAALQSPVGTIERLMEFHSSANSNPVRMLKSATAQYSVGSRTPASPQIAGAVPDSVPEAYRSIIGAFANAISKASSEIRAATERISAEERRGLIESLPNWIDDDPDFKPDFVRNARLRQSAILELMEKVDLARIRNAAIELAESLDDQIPRFQATAKTNPFTGQLRFNVGKLVCVLGGIGPNVHRDKDAVLTLDLGGDDEYSGRHGAGVGYASVLLDLGGNDRYKTPDLSIGAAILGIGLAYDLGGNDVFRGGSVSYGSGIAGVGVFHKKGGNDLYQSSRLTQGFGAFGIGLCIDTLGKDTFDAIRWSQGSARANGIGWLADLGGDDTYRCNSKNSGSMAQGFAEGERGALGGLPGGMGLLTDLSGDDVYVAGYSAQGSATWLALGSIYDRFGDDSYVAKGNAQAYGQSFGCGFAMDLQGNDSYLCKEDIGHARSHDFGIAVLFDRDGDDLYATAQFRPCFATANGVSLFLDGDGEDRYSGSPGQTIYSGDSHSISVFADLNGPDHYGWGMENVSARLNANGGVAYDQETKTKLSTIPEIEVPPRPGSKPLPTVSQLDAIFDSASRSIGKARMDAIFSLIAFGLPAIESLVSRRLASFSELELLVLGEIIEAIGQDARNLIALKVTDSNDNKAANALQICLDFGFNEAGAVIIQALQRPSLQRLAARGAGEFNNPLAVSELMVLCSKADSELVVNCLRSLKKFADPQSSGTAQALLDSPDRQIRNAAISLLSSFATPAMASAAVYLREPEIRKARIGCEIYAALGTVEALNELGKALSDPKPGVRIQAMVGLAGRCPIEFRGKFIELRNDFEPQVRSVAVLLDPGR